MGRKSSGRSRPLAVVVSLAVAVGGVVVPVSVGGVPAAGATATTVCEIQGIRVPVEVPFAATPRGGAVEIEITFPELPIDLTIESATIVVPIPADVESVGSVVFSGGNLPVTYSIEGGEVLVTVTGPAPSDAVELPTALVSFTLEDGADPSLPRWVEFESLTAETDVGTATCEPTTEPPPPPLTATTPDPDPFYAPDPGFETEPPGTVLRSRPFSVRLSGRVLPIAATQALFRTTDTVGEPVATVVTLLRSPIPYKHGARPLVSYQFATDSLGARCQPSRALAAASGGNVEMILVLLLLLSGYHVAIPDYEGPRFAYGAGRMEGQAVLDGIRAAESLPGTGLAGVATPVGMWGYSGGAIASGWAAELHGSYAPELDIRGVASGGTPADLLATARHMDGTFMSGFMLLVAVALAREYPYFGYAFNDAGRALAADLADACTDKGLTGYPFRRIGEFVSIDDPLTNPLVVKALEDTKLGRVAPRAPVFLYHAVHDEGIPFAEAVALHTAWCEKGADVTFYADRASEHVILPITQSWRALRFLRDRFRGTPTAGTCPPAP
ncbi:MAG: hypothetical protein IT198_07160 [Acidimicrobiia bacterium]|nr:hypothetical protein [Acidimicrobiia bacterium]